MRYLAALSLVAFAPLFSTALRSAPANDKIENAIQLSANQLANRATGSVTGVTTDPLAILLPGSQVPVVGYLFPAIWYKWTAPVKGTVYVQGTGRNFVIFGTTLVGPLEQDVYPVAGTSDNTVSYSNILSTTSYTYETEPGVTYYNALETWLVSSPNTFNYIHRFDQAALSDSFAERTQMGGVDFTVFGSNASYTVEEGEPTHTSGSQVASGRSVWTTWRSPDSRKGVTLEVSGRGFTPAIAVYTGDALGTLKLVTRNSSTGASANGVSAFASFVAEDGIDYHIAIDGADNRSGSFSLKLTAKTVRPGFLTAPVATTVFQGETAVFTATAAYTGESITYEWQRQAAGSKEWLTLGDSDIYSGTNTPVLSVITTLGMNNDRFRVLATDIVGTSASKPALLTVTEFPAFNTEVLGSVGTTENNDLNISLGTIPEPTNGGTYFATGLPKGLSINPQTGEITGTIDAKPGTYRVTYGSTNGKKKNPETFIVQIIVAPLSPYLAGSFEALVNSFDGRATPEGKVSFKVAGNGRLTGSYYSIADGKSYPFRGAIVLDQEARTGGNPAQTPVRISRGGRTPLFLEFSMAEPPAINDEVTGNTVVSSVVFDSNNTILAKSADGAPVSPFSAANPAPWAGRYTLRAVQDSFTVGQPGSNPALPIGSGHATGTVAEKTGVLALRGVLADNTLFTASLASSPDATYRLAQRVYGPGGKFAGRLNLDEQLAADDTTVSYHSNAFSDSLAHWTKPGRPKDKLYPAGFQDGIVVTKLLMEPWINPNRQIPASLGLNAGGDMKIQIVSAIPQDGNDSNPYELPVDVQLNPTGTLGFVNPATNKTNFTLKITPLTGAFTGSYELAEPDSAGKKPRKVSFSGVLFQNADVYLGDVIGEGFAIVPPLLSGEPTASASIKFLAGPPDSPFGITRP